MKKRLLFCVFALIVFPVCHAASINDAESLLLGLNISSEVNIIPLETGYYVEYLTANLSFFPRETSYQKVRLNALEPEPEETGNSLLFRWKEPKGDVGFMSSYDVSTKRFVGVVKSRVLFPLEGLRENLEYANPSENIDSDNESVVRLASQLAEGEDDLFVVVHNLAVWTQQNINYNLSTLTVSASQKASWVLENREGVCDEMTSLFIALNRALGIPARFVTGVAYTDYELLEEGWGLHGWAEVYFPGYGWVPFDVAYGEFGFVDASHVKLKDSVDSNEFSTTYEWKSSNAEIVTEKLNLEAWLKSEGKKASPYVTFDVKAIRDSVGFGSYNLVEVSVENLQDFYVSTDVVLSKTQGMEVSGGNKRMVLLKPNEERKVYFIVRVSEDLDRSYKYIFPVVIYSSLNTSSSVNFIASYAGKNLSLNYIHELAEARYEEETKTYSQKVDLDCSPGKDNLYIYEPVRISCRVRNGGNVFIEDLDVCLNECVTLDLGIAQEKEVIFPATFSKTGENELRVSAKNKEITKGIFVLVNVFDEPNIEITSLSSPQNVSFSESFNVSFVLDKTSLSTPFNVNVLLMKDAYEIGSWNITAMEEDRFLFINIHGKDLEKENRYRLVISYEDGNSKQHRKERGFSVYLKEPDFWQRIKMLVSFLGGWVEA